MLVYFDSKTAALEADEALREGASIHHPRQETSCSSQFVALVNRCGARRELPQGNETAGPASDADSVG